MYNITNSVKVPVTRHDVDNFQVFKIIVKDQNIS